MKIITFLADGIYAIANSYVEPRRYHQPRVGGFVRDQARFKSDVRTVGRDMEITISRHGKSQYTR